MSYQTEHKLNITDFKKITQNGQFAKPALEVRHFPYAAGTSRPHVLAEAVVDVPLLDFPLLRKTGIVTHGFTTRIGGVSQGVCSSMNISFDQCDEKRFVEENIRRVASALGTVPERMIYTEQQHTTNVRVVTSEDAGKGTVRERGWHDVDGLVTNVPGIVLCAFGSDCTTLFFIDPVHRAIGLSHAGWRGTVHGMAEATLRVMHEQYGSEPNDVVAAIGPSICRECYEIGRDVAEEVERLHPDLAGEVLDPYPNEKFRLDLHLLNKRLMEKAGIPGEQIAVTDVCTMCNPELLFSHRVMGSQRGNNAAMLMLK